MRVCLTCARVLVAVAIALLLTTNSEARMFGRARCWSNYQYPSSYQYTYAPTATTESGTVVSTTPAGPTFSSVSQQTITETPTSSGNVIYSEPVMTQPSGQSSGGWSMFPRNITDYGKFPPYR
jgi:hypothetical protein